MKALKAFEDQEVLELTQFMPEPCEIDEEMYYHILCGYVPSSYHFNSIGQAGEPERNAADCYYYMTVSMVNKKFFYLGILPEFKTRGQL